MDLNSGYPYFLLKHGLFQDFEILRSDLTTDVVVLGGGISGALMAQSLIREGVACVVIDKRKLGLGSTAASTSLLQYEIDVPLYQLSEKIGRAPAVKAYSLCSEAIDRINKTAGEIGYKDIKACSSVYFSHTSRKNNLIQKEYRSRKEAGFAVSYLEENEIRKRYGLSSKEAIVSEKAAYMDAYLFTHFLYRYSVSKGVRVFENTTVEKISANETGVELSTNKGCRIRARKIIYATGYEVVEQISKSIVTLKSTYAFATEPIPGLPAYYGENVFWNTAEPYMYMRADKNRLIIGGKDENFRNPAARAVLLEKKTKKLQEDFNHVFPGLAIRPQFAWAGIFGSTKDGLPYIGTYDKAPNSYFALGFGGNGITFSALAADLIVRLIKGDVNAVPEIFRFNR